MLLYFHETSLSRLNTFRIYYILLYSPLSLIINKMEWYGMEYKSIKLNSMELQSQEMRAILLIIGGDLEVD